MVTNVFGVYAPTQRLCGSYTDVKKSVDPGTWQSDEELPLSDSPVMLIRPVSLSV